MDVVNGRVSGGLVATCRAGVVSSQATYEESPGCLSLELSIRRGSVWELFVTTFFEVSLVFALLFWRDLLVLHHAIKHIALTLLVSLFLVSFC